MRQPYGVDFRAKGSVFMLLDRYRQMLTAYVDGELNSRQRRHVVRLLHRSREARHLFRQLQADARLLRDLPRPTLAADLSAAVLRTIAERRLRPGQGCAAKDGPPAMWLLPLASWVAAAAVLLILGAASYLYFISVFKGPEQPELAQSKAEPFFSTPAPKEPNDSIAAAGKQQKTSEPPAPSIHPSSSNKLPAAVESAANEPKPRAPIDPPPQGMGKKARGSGKQSSPPDPAPDSQSEDFKVGDLEREPVRKRLLAALGKDKVFRLELPCPNGTKAFDRANKAARALRWRFIIDKQAQEPIKMKRMANYIIYLEDVTPEEVVQFVRQIGADDRKNAAGNPGEEQIGSLVLMKMTARHRRQLSTLLGIDPTTTAPKGDNSAGKSSEHVALVLTYFPDPSTPDSEEIKRFLGGRKPLRPGTLRIVLVLRS